MKLTYTKTPGQLRLGVFVWGNVLVMEKIVPPPGSDSASCGDRFQPKIGLPPRF